MIHHLRGHLVTIAPTLRHNVWPFLEPPARPWTAHVPDERRGSVLLTGRLHEPPGADTALVIIHGLGGSCESYYVIRAACAAYACGYAVLRFNMRGANGSGTDLYHGGLTRDIHAALRSEALSSYRRLLLLGYSMGGHMSLNAATEDCDPRLRAVAAIHSPLDLDASCVAIDRTRALVYRRFLLRQLFIDYRALYHRFGGPTPIAEAARIRTFREWDERVTGPVWGFAGAAEYYRSASVAARLSKLQVPALLLAERRDPVVPASVIEPFAERAGASLAVRWTDSGGHVGYPSSLFATIARDGEEHRIIDWLGSH